MGMSAEAIFAGDGVFEKKIFKRIQSERHVGPEEDKEPDTSEILDKIRSGGRQDDAKEGKLPQDDGNEEKTDIYREDGFFGEKAVKVKNGRDGDGDN